VLESAVSQWQAAATVILAARLLAGDRDQDAGIDGCIETALAAVKQQPGVRLRQRQGQQHCYPPYQGKMEREVPSR